MKPVTGRRSSFTRLSGALALLLALGPGVLSAGEARMEVFQFESRALKDNPLRDPVSRPVPVFLPAQAANGAHLPVVYYLPGYGDTTESFIQFSNLWLKFTQKVADEITPMVIVMVDGTTRWGGSQYLNSPAQGNYEDYVCDDIVAAVEARHPDTDEWRAAHHCGPLQRRIWRVAPGQFAATTV